MVAAPAHNAAWLLKAAKELSLQLKPQIAGTVLKRRTTAKLRTTPTETAGWAVVLGSLGRGCTVELWLDRFSGHQERKLYVCFYSRDEKVVKALSAKVTKELWPVRHVSDEDVIDDDTYVLKEPLPKDKFNAPITEHFYNYGHHFFGFYDPTRISSARVSPQFLERAVGFIVNVLRSMPGVSEADVEAEVYPRCENRKLVQSHLRRERSGYLAAECKGRDGYKCQICAFEFAKKYGETLGSAFAEAHHIVPLGKQGDRVRSRLEDLVTVCANCHRMLHRMEGKGSDISRLTAIVRKQRRGRA